MDNRSLISTLRSIARANPGEWDASQREMFQQWAQNRARAAIEAYEANIRLHEHFIIAWRDGDGALVQATPEPFASHLEACQQLRGFAQSAKPEVVKMAGIGK